MMGDMHTVSAFRLAGVEGVVAVPDRAAGMLEELVRKKDAAVLLITNELAAGLAERITDINLNQPSPVILEIPGIDDTSGFRGSVMGYVEEALGISL